MTNTTLRRIAFATLMAAGFGSAQAERFEGLSFTVGLMPVLSLFQAQPDAPEYDTGATTDSYYDFDQKGIGGLMGELCLSYNFSRYYIGVSGFGAAGLEASGTYRIHGSGSGGGFLLEDDAPFRIRQYITGAGAEIGFCRGTSNYYGGGSSDSEAYMHWGIAAGPYLLVNESDIPVIDGTSYGIYGKMRFQLLLGDNWGLEAMAHVGGYFAAGLGAFYKLP